MAGNNFGLHLTIDIENCDAKKLTNNHFIYSFLDILPSKIGMTKIILPYVIEYVDKWAKTPGLSGFVMIAESHISIHTFPEQNYIFMDVFSCRHFDTKPVIEIIKKEFGSDKATIKIVERGKNFVKPP